jgi:hypothetical protein
VKWAIEGRSKEKLEDLRKQLAEINPKCADVPILTADLNDPKSLDKLVKQGDVLISTAGPFWTIGTPVVCMLNRPDQSMLLPGQCQMSMPLYFLRARFLHARLRRATLRLVHFAYLAGLGPCSASMFLRL